MISLTFKKIGSLLIVNFDNRIIVNFTVEFDDQFFFRTVKVYNKWTDTMLSPKLST